MYPVCFIPAKGLIRDLSANLSNVTFEVALAPKWWWQSGLISHKDSQLRNMSFNNLEKMFDELAERSLVSPLAGTKHIYVRLANNNAL